MLWSAAAILARSGKSHWIATLPAIFMTAVCATFAFNSNLFLGLAIGPSTWLGLLATILATAAFMRFGATNKGRKAKF